MIIVRLKGGLGNQMFQYAFGRKRSIDQKTNLKLDKTSVTNSIWQKMIGVTPRKFELGEFDIKIRFSNIWENIFAILFQGNSYFDDYWQSEKYFADIREVICDDFRLRHESKNFEKAEKIISTKRNSVGLHIRRGDYAEDEKTKKYHGLLKINYYRKAAGLVTRKVKNPHFFIFSDDPKWVKNNFRIKTPATLISGNYKLTNAEELVLMSLCKHNIIANSSFSWWGAWLNKNPKKIVIAPQKWFKVKIDDRDIVPANWVRI